MKAVYREKPKDRNVEKEKMIYRHNKRVNSIKKDRVETNLK